MKKIILIACLITTILFALRTSTSFGQTPGTLTFSVTTTEPSGGYTGVHVIALWIEDTNGVFIKTKIRYAQDRIQYLDQWVASSAYNVVDATTGATLASHGTLTFTWNGTDAGGNVVADKPYKVWLQMSDRNLSGKTTFVTFTKDTNSVNLTPADTGNFTNMVLQWNPVIGINEVESRKLAFTCEPSPFNEHATIKYTLSQNSDVTITLHDASGKIAAVLCDGNQKEGEHSIQFPGSSNKLAAGIYYLKINTGNLIEVKKVICNH